MGTLQVANLVYNSAGTIRVGADGPNLKITTTGTTRINNMSTMNVAGNVYVTHQITGGGGTELISVSIASQQNNWSVSGISPSKGVWSIINANATSSLKLTGLDTTGFDVGKMVTIRNNTNTTLATSTMILLEVDSPSSSAANRFSLQYKGRPVIVMPNETIDFIFDGESLLCVGGTRTYGQLGYSCYDTYHSPHTQFYMSGDYYAFDTFSSTINTLYGRQINQSWYGYSAGSVFPWAIGGPQYRYGSSLGNNSTAVYVAAALMTLSTAANDFIAMVGMNSGYAFRETTANTPVCHVGWEYRRAVNTTHWLISTKTANVSTNVVSPVLIVANTFAHLGFFVNGDATRADFFYSTDMGNTWSFITSPITTNIPRNARNASANSIGLSYAMSRQTGNVANYLIIAEAGALGT